MRLFYAVAALLRSIFGIWQWQPPAWLLSFGHASSRLKKHARENRRASVAAAAAFVGIVLVTTGAYVLYARRPQPLQVDASLTVPEPTALVEDVSFYPLRITFESAVAPLASVNREVKAGVHLTPELPGIWRWEGDRELRFAPTRDWAVGQDYQVRLDPEAIAENVLLKNTKFSFHTVDFKARTLEFKQYQDPRDPSIKKMVATLAFNYALDGNTLAKRVHIAIDPKSGLLPGGHKELPFTVTFAKLGGEAYITSAPIRIPKEDSVVELRVDSGLRAVRGGKPNNDKLTETSTAPGMFSYFHVDSAQLDFVRNDSYEAERVLVVSFNIDAPEAGVNDAVEAFLLPARKKAWQDESNFDEATLRTSTSLKLTPIASATPEGPTHSFKYDAPLNRQIYVRVKRGLHASGGYVLAKSHSEVLRVPSLPKALEIMHDGAILSLSGDKKLSVMARGLSGVDLQIERIDPSAINHLVSQTQGTFSTPEFMSSWAFDETNISEHFKTHLTFDKSRAGKAQFGVLDSGAYFDRSHAEQRGLFWVTVSEAAASNKSDASDEAPPDADAYEPPEYDEDAGRNSSVGKQHRVVLLTDLAILVKDNLDLTHDVFVQSIAKGGPVGDVRVDVVGKNGVALTSARTDDSGHASLPRLDATQAPEKPTAYVVHKGPDVAFLPYDARDRALDFSRFDIGGADNASGKSDLRALVFSDRGIYRPGDLAHIGMIVKASDWRKPLGGVPLEMAVYDPRGLEVRQHRVALPASGYLAAEYQTHENAPTGDYQIVLRVARDPNKTDRPDEVLGDTHVRVEEFLPDRMHLTSALSKPRSAGWVSPEDLQGIATLTNLFGTSAEGHRMGGKLRISPGEFAFCTQYPGFSFGSPKTVDTRVLDTLDEEKSDSTGTAKFDFKLDRFAAATYRLQFFAEGFEMEGGRSVRAESSTLVSSLPYAVGVRSEADLRYVKRGEPAALQMVAVNPNLQQTAAGDLQVRLVEVKFVSTLMKQNNGTYKYESVRKEVQISQQALSIPLAGSSYELPTARAGQFKIVLLRGDSVVNTCDFNVVGDADISRSLERNAELELTLDKSDYNAGEEITLQVRSPYVGAGLITIEREGVYAHTWFRASTTSSVQKIRIPAGVEGNAYVVVTLLRAPDSKEIFMSPLSYGVAPFSLSRKERTLDVKLASDSVVRPGEPLSITYQTNQAANIIVYAVDEGILQVARYKTPAPLDLFLQKRRFQVETLQLLDLLLPEYSVYRQVASSGGDEDANGLGRFLNPFKRRRDAPVAYWSGVVAADTTPRTLRYDVPDYFNGALRLMAVAVSPSAMGAQSQPIKVRGDFVLLPNIPAAVAPGDSVALTATLSRTDAAVAATQTSVTITAGDALAPKGPTDVTVALQGTREGVIRTTWQAQNRLGAVDTAFSARAGSLHGKQVGSLSIRPAVPFTTTTKAVIVPGHGHARIDLPRRMFTEEGAQEVTASYLPIGIAHVLTHYLGSYPHECTEQLVSKAMPALAAKSLPLFAATLKDASVALDRALVTLESRQNSEGAFGVWGANSYTSDVQNAYVAQFLTEAAELGVSIPPNTVRQSLSYMRDLVRDMGGTLSDKRTRAHAIYVLTRNGDATLSLLTELQRTLDSGKASGWQTDLTAVYMAASYTILQEHQAAAALMKNWDLDVTQEQDLENYYDANVFRAQSLLLLARHFPERLKSMGPEVLVAFSKTVAEQSYNTLSSGYTLLALATYTRSAALDKGPLPNIKEQAASSKPVALTGDLFMHGLLAAESTAVEIDNPRDAPLFVGTEQRGFDKEVPKVPQSTTIEVSGDLRDANDNVVTTVKLGEEVTEVVHVRGSKFSYVAVTSLLPGGFEVVPENDRGEKPADENLQVREDRVLWFGTVRADAKTLRFRLKATAEGSFVVPPVSAEGMYDRSVTAHGGSGTVTVISP